MDNLLLVFTSLLIGILLRRSPKSPRDTHEVLNRFVIYVSLPALVLVYIPAIEIDRTLLYPVLSAWLVLLIAIIIIPLLGKLAGWDRNTIGCLLLTAGFGNTAFVGFPVIEALYGSEGLRIALLVDQPGTFMALSTAGIVIASIYSSGRTRKRVILRKVFLFPPFIMFLLAICMNLGGVTFEGAILGTLEKLGATMAPLALVSVGFQLKFRPDRELIAPMAGGLVVKLLIAPLILTTLYFGILGGHSLSVKVSIMEAAMAPMVTGSIVATSYGLNPKLASYMIGIGIPISFATLTVWYLILELLI